MIVTVVYIAWAAIGSVWLLGAFGGKQTVRREESGGRMLHLAATFLAGYLLFSPSRSFGFFDARFVPETFPAQLAGLLLTIGGIAFAIWARLMLGHNWSADVTIKQDHMLIRGGPYRYVRHPIYSGALLAMLGTAIVFGEARGLCAVVLALAAWRRKSLTEEQFMLELFGEEYRRYQREVSALIPGIL